MLANLALALNDVPMDPGESFRIIALSFDADDTPAIAHRAKKNYFGLINREFSEAHWRFLTGDQKEIDRLLQQLGYLAGE